MRLPRTVSQKRQKGQGWKEGKKGRKERRKEEKNEILVRRKKEDATNSNVGYLP
jgi:hypothetical protein